jgi:polyisoprenoid-binding protein YceI
MRALLNRSVLIAFAALACASCAAAARVVYPVNTNALKAQPGDYEIDPDHVSVIFAVNHLGFSLYYGRFSEISGRLSLDVETPERSEVAVRIASASIDTTSEELNEKLRGEEMFDAAVFPDIVFESTRVLRTGERTADVEGALTIKGVTRPITLQTEFIGSGRAPLLNDRRAGFSAKARLSRRDFGLDAWSGFVGDEVDLLIAAEFKAR